MNDDVKAAVEWLRKVVTKTSHGITVLDLKQGQALLAHIDGEPARIAAACEEVREACARNFPKPPEESHNDPWAARLVRATPLTATPLADALRLANETVVKLAQAATEAQARATEGVRYWTDLAQAEARDAAALRARVAELEAAANTAGADASAAALRAMARATKAEAERDGWRKEANRWPELLAQAVAERDSLRARRCDAYSLLRPEFDGVTFCRKDGARAAQDVLDERDALRAKVFEVEQRQVGYVLVSFASHEQWKAELAELGALRARLDALYGVTLFAHAFAEAEPLVSGYVRLHGHILHLREIHALARAATQAMDEAKPETKTAQQAESTGSMHLRPDGRECVYLGSPPVCTKCGSLLEPISIKQKLEEAVTRVVRSASV